MAKYDPVKRREYNLRTRELKGRGRGLTRYTKKGKGSEELRRDEEARQNMQRELMVLAQKIKQQKEQGNTDSPAYRHLVDGYVGLLNTYRKVYARAGSSVLDAGENVAQDEINLGKRIGRTGEKLARSELNLGKATVKVGGKVGSAAADHALATGRVVEQTTVEPYVSTAKILARHSKKPAKKIYDWLTKE